MKITKEVYLKIHEEDDLFLGYCNEKERFMLISDGVRIFMDRDEAFRVAKEILIGESSG